MRSKSLSGILHLGSKGTPIPNLSGIRPKLWISVNALRAREHFLGPKRIPIVNLNEIRQKLLIFHKISTNVFAYCGCVQRAKQVPFWNSSFGIQRGSNPEFEQNRTKIVDFSLNKRERFCVLRARAVCKVSPFQEFFIWDPKGFQSQI